MTLKEKNRLSGIFLMIHGGVLSLLILGVSIFMGVLGFSAPGSDTWIFFLFGVFYFIYFLIFVVPQIIGGWKMYKEEPNAKKWGIVASILACFNFPLGTAAGVYALIFLFGEEGKEFYSHLENQNNHGNPNLINQKQLLNAQLNNIPDFDKSKNREPHIWMDNK